MYDQARPSNSVESLHGAKDQTDDLEDNTEIGGKSCLKDLGITSGL